MKYMVVKVVRPIVIHGGEVVDVKELAQEIRVQQSIDKTRGVYVYAAGHDWPESSAGKIIHCWFKSANVLKYLKEWEGANKHQHARVVFTGHGFRLEKIENQA